MAQAKGQMTTQLGFIIGMFAYGHPFLDGNVLAMLLVHSELCYRASMSLDWLKTSKQDYLVALTKEIEAPNDGHLDAYLQPFIGAQIPRENWGRSVVNLPGLDGANARPDDVAGYADLAIAQGYLQFERRRGYRLGS